MEFDDNYELAEDSPGHVVGSVTSLSTAIAAKARTYSLELNGRVGIRKYAGPGATSDLDGVDPYISLGFTKGSKLTDYTLSTSFRRQDATAAEFDDTGVTNVNGDRLTFHTNAGVVHQVDRLNSLIFSADATIVDFTEDAASLTPYFDANMSLGWKRMIAPRTHATIKGSVGYYNADDAVDTESWIFGASFGLNHRVNRRLTVSGGVGVNHVRTERMTGDENNTGISGNLNVDYKRKHTTVYFSLSQAFEPGSEGEIENRTRAQVGVSHKINSKSAVSMNASYGISDPVGGNSDTRQSVSLSPLFTYMPAPHWETSLGYTFRYIDDDETAHSHKVFFSVSRDFTLLH